MRDDALCDGRGRVPGTRLCLLCATHCTVLSVCGVSLAPVLLPDGTRHESPAACCTLLKHFENDLQTISADLRPRWKDAGQRAAPSCTREDLSRTHAVRLKK